MIFNGLIAETFVYQEFENELVRFHRPQCILFHYRRMRVATEFIYWYNDTAYIAVLKVKQQATNPGTGSGGVAALVNDYIGRNGIKD